MAIGLDATGDRDGSDDDDDVDVDRRAGTSLAVAKLPAEDGGLGSNLELGPQGRAA